MNRALIYDEELLAEARAFNSTLTPAGRKPGTRSGSGPRGGGVGLNPSRSAGAKYGLRPRVDTGSGMVGHHVSQASVGSRGGAGVPVGSGKSHSPTTISSWSNPQVGSDFTPASYGDLVGSSMMTNPTPGASFQVDTVANPAQASHVGFGSSLGPNATTQPTYEELAAELEIMRAQMKLMTQIGGLMGDTSVTSTQTPPRAANLSQTANGTLVPDNNAHVLQVSVAAISRSPATPSSSHQGSDAAGSPVLERKLITTNWGMYGEPVGPDIPGHLRQSYAPAAIQEIARMTGKPYGEVTKDGVTLTGPPIKKRDASQQKSDTHTGVDHTLIKDANANHRMLSSEMAIVAPETKPASAQEEFNESVVAGNQWNSAWKKSSAALSAPAWVANAAVNKAENVPPIISILQDPNAASSFATPTQRAKLFSVSTQAANTSFSHSSHASSVNARSYAGRSVQNGSRNVFDARSFTGHAGNSFVLQPAPTPSNGPIIMSTASTKEDGPVAATEAERATRAFTLLASKPGNKFKDSRWAD